MISTKSERKGKPLKSSIWMTEQIVREKSACSGNYSTCAKVRSLQNFQAWQFASLSLRKQHRKGLNGTVKSLKSKKKSRTLLFSVNLSSSWRFLVSFFAWNANMAGRLLELRRSIFCTTYLKPRISANICFHFRLSQIQLRVLDKIFLVRKRWVHKKASSTRMNSKVLNIPSNKGKNPLK